MNGIRKMLVGCENTLAIVAGMLLLLMMAITSLDVVMRYVFHAPLAWGFDLVTHYLLVATFFFSFSIALRTGGHVAVDYFVNRFPRGFRRGAMALAWAACGLLAALITVTSVIDTAHAWKASEVVAGVIPWPVWVQKAIVALGMGPLALRLLLLSIRAVPSPSSEEEMIELSIDAKDQ